MALSISDLPAIYALLANSLSGDENMRKPAETSLSESESRPGFCCCLLEVISAKDLVSMVDIRLMASVYLKNCVKRRWRAISMEEKLQIRQKLLTHLNEQHDQIAHMLAVIISKIVRADFPKEWPEFFTVIGQKIQTADVLTSHRIYLIFFRALKELSTKRLTSDQKNFAQISSQLIDYVWKLWHKDFQNVISGFSALLQVSSSNPSELQLNDLYVTCERWLLCLKILRQMVIFGFQKGTNNLLDVKPVKETAHVLLETVQSLLPFYSSFHIQHRRFWDFVRRMCVKLMKVLVSIQGRYPYSFGDESVLRGVLDFCLTMIMDNEPGAITFEEILIQCMMMVKLILECKEYKPNLVGRVKDETETTLDKMKHSFSSTISGIVSSHFSSERVVRFCDILIRRYFILTEKDLGDWYRNPELFHHEQNMIQWTEKIRPCAEALYIVLFENYAQQLSPIVLSLLQESMNNCPTTSTAITPALLLKEAAYSATVYVSYELSNYLNFKDWFNHALSLEVTYQHFPTCVIHRKIALILGHWVSEIKDDTRRSVYFALIRLLQDKDLCVKLAACGSLFLLVEDSNFSEVDFTDLLPDCWDLCFSLFEEVEEFDSKNQVLSLISVLIARVSEITPFSDKLQYFFKKGWEESTGESLLRIQLLVALRNFVVALGYQSPACYNMLLPILQGGIDINNPDELNILEDSILLWEATITNAPFMIPELLGLFSYLEPVMERDFVHLQAAAKIMEGYIILGRNEFLSQHSTTVAKLLDLIVGNVSNKGLLSCLPVIDLLVQCYPREMPPMIISTLQKLYAISLASRDDGDPASETVRTHSVAVLARIMVMNTNFLAEMTSNRSLLDVLQKAGFTVEGDILLTLIDTWIHSIDNASPLQKKTFGLALSLTLTFTYPQVLEKLDKILSSCATAILSADVVSSEEEYTNQFEGAVQNNDLRRRQIMLLDPINHLPLESSVKKNIETCASLHGESFNVAINRMHPSALAQLKNALKMP